MNVGVIVARIQTPYLHQGHVSLIHRVKTKSDRVVMPLGVAPIISERNLLTYSLRERMLHTLDPAIITIPLLDRREDRDWAAELDSFLYRSFPGAKVTLYGCRDSCLERYRVWGYNEVQHLDSQTIDGSDIASSKIRAQLLESDTIDFRSGYIMGAMAALPRVVPAVDVVIYDKPNHKLLLVRKHGEMWWRLPGGMIERTDANFEQAALREVKEETGLTVSSLEYLGTHNVDDWRYRNTNIAVFSTLYAAAYEGGYAAPLDTREIAEVAWFPYAIWPNQLVTEHIPLLTRFWEWAHYPNGEEAAA